MPYPIAKENLNRWDLPQLFQYIIERDDIDDFRDLFEQLHNWSHNTDFTYQSITDPERHKLKEYLIRYIEDTEDED